VLRLLAAFVDITLGSIASSAKLDLCAHVKVGQTRAYRREWSSPIGVTRQLHLGLAASVLCPQV
jgi:hypothetical protein